MGWDPRYPSAGNTMGAPRAQHAGLHRPASARVRAAPPASRPKSPWSQAARCPRQAGRRPLLRHRPPPRVAPRQRPLGRVSPELRRLSRAPRSLGEALKRTAFSCLERRVHRWRDAGLTWKTWGEAQSSDSSPKRLLRQLRPRNLPTLLIPPRSSRDPSDPSEKGHRLSPDSAFGSVLLSQATRGTALKGHTHHLDKCLNSATADPSSSFGLKQHHFRHLSKHTVPLPPVPPHSCQLFAVNEFSASAGGCKQGVFSLGEGSISIVPAKVGCPGNWLDSSENYLNLPILMGRLPTNLCQLQ